MHTHLVTYDLRAPKRDYSSLYRAIESVGLNPSRPLESVWIVQTPLNSTQVVARISPHLDQNDGLLVAPVTDGPAGLRLDHPGHPRLGAIL
jgi:hypothetical protein